MTTEYFRWYHDEAELKSGSFLGSVPLEYIYNCVASKMASGEMPAMSIGATLWMSRDGKEEGKRDFFFGCVNELDRDDWIMSLEFMRTKAVYDKNA